jgi:hypothetical protein
MKETESGLVPLSELSAAFDKKDEERRRGHRHDHFIFQIL